jgi:hypothetical protein
MSTTPIPETPARRAYFLIPEFAEASRKSLTLEIGSGTVGRNEFGIKDKRCSRKQLQFDVVEGSKLVHVTQLGLNVCQLSSESGVQRMTERGVAYAMGDGDRIGLIGSEFVLRLEVSYALRYYV